jgi:hypothetical protein
MNNPLQEKFFEIQIDDELLLLMSYNNIHKEWLHSASLYLQKAEAHDTTCYREALKMRFYCTTQREGHQMPANLQYIVVITPLHSSHPISHHTTKY